MNTPEKVKTMRSSMCNIRSEKILDRASYWYRIRTNRCLIPIKGFYEHRAIKGWKSKVPYYIELKDRELFCLPGLYAYAPLPDLETGEVRGTYAPVTRAANSVMRQIHNDGDNAFRMPLLLPKELEMKWLQPDLTDAELQDILSYEMPADQLDYRTVWTIRTTKPHPQQGKKTDLFNWPNLPPLGMDDGELQKAMF
jgi:putative SOS response-associated peptidase YedK